MNKLVCIKLAIMPEQISQPNKEASSEEAKANPRAEELVDEAVGAFGRKDIEGLDEAILKLGQELGVELETRHEEALQRNQLMYDFLFGEGKYNLKREYIEGHIKLFTKEQEKALKKECYREFLIIDGSLSREEIEQAINRAYAEKSPTISQSGIPMKPKKTFLKPKPPKRTPDRKDST